MGGACFKSKAPLTTVYPAPEEKASEQRRGSGEVIDRFNDNSIRKMAKLRRSNSIDRDYEIDEDKVCGTGFAGPVLLSKHKASGKICAVKSYNKKTKTPRQFEMLRSEVEVYLGLDHPHIARLHDVYETDLMLHLVMEYCSGGELYHRLVKYSGYSELKAADATYQMLTALNYLHNQAKVVHRDLKLENWLYASKDDDAPLKLIDFGFSKSWEMGESQNMQQACGSLPYAAPELLMRSYTNKCDMWSLGVIVFMMLSGEPPFYSSQGDQAVKAKILNGQYHMRPEKWGKVSRSAKHFVASLLSVNPDERLGAIDALNHEFIKARREAARANNEALDVDVARGLRDFMTQSHFKRAALCMMAYSLNSEEISEFEEMFKQMDVDHTGEVSMDDFIAVMKENLVISNDEVQRMFAAMGSVDGKQSKLSYTQFVAALLQTRVQMHSELLREVFDRFDMNKKGAISVTDLKKVMGEDGFEGKSVDEVCKEIGVSKNEEINFERFMEIMTSSNQVAKASNARVDDALTKQAQTAGGDAIARARAGSAVRMSRDKKQFGTAPTANQTPEMLEFEAKLRKNGIDVSKFGKGDAKKIEDLFWEVQKSECVMGMQKGAFKRFLDVLRVELWCTFADGDRRMLMEADQELQDGRKRKRTKPMSKKMSVGETWEDALHRAFGAELKVNPGVMSKHFKITQKEPSFDERESVGYPGIKTVYQFHNVHVEVIDANESAISHIGLPEGSDFETEELSIVGTDRKHYWTWQGSNNNKEVPADTASITSSMRSNEDAADEALARSKLKG